MLSFNLANKGKMLSFASGCGLSCDLEHPRTIQEKLMWLNIYDVDPLKVVCADKLKVKDWVKDKLGVDICVPTLKVWDGVDDMDIGELPKSFVLKCNHGSGMNIIVRDKDGFDVMNAKHNLGKWLNRDFAFQNGFESHYHWIDRKVFAEEMLGVNVSDYKFICFNGVPTFMQIISDRSGSSRRLNYYDMDMKPIIGLSRKDFRTDFSIGDVMPKEFALMKEYARKLSEPFKFVRVDFYEVDGRVLLGELTFTPGAFVFRYRNSKDEYRVGDMLKIG